MVKRLLRSIRQKPQGVRDQIAFGVAVVFTGSIFVVWLITAPTRFTSNTADSSASEGESTGFADIFGGFSEVIEQSRAAAGQSTATEVPEQPEPTLAEMLDALAAERAASESLSTSTVGTSSEVLPVTVWNSLPTTTPEKEVRIMPVNNQATATATSSPSE